MYTIYRKPRDDRLTFLAIFFAVSKNITTFVPSFVSPAVGERAVFHFTERRIEAHVALWQS